MAANFQENSFDFCFGVVRSIDSFQTVIRQTAAVRVEVIVANIQRVDQIVKGIDVDIGSNRQAIQIFVIGFGVFHHHRAIGAPGGQHRRFKRAVGGNTSVMCQVVDWIVGGAYQFHISLRHQTACAEFRGGEQFVTFIPSAFGGAAIEQAIGNAKGFTQLQMRPMVKRVAQGVRHGCTPLLKLFPIAGIASTKTLVHAVGAHSAPFVMIACQPNFSKVFELLILTYLLGGKMAVVINDRHVFGVLMKEYFGLLGVEQKVVVDKAHSHNSSIMPKRQQSCVRLCDGKIIFTLNASDGPAQTLSGQPVCRETG